MSIKINRRTVLKSVTGAALFPALLPATAAPAQSGKWRTAIGLNGFQSGTRKYKKNYPIWEVLDFASRQGFQGVELVSDWPAGGYPASREKERIQALRRLYRGFGLSVFSIQVGADGAFDPDTAKRRAWIASFQDRAQFAKELGCDCVGMWPGGNLRGQTIDQALERLVESFREAAKIAGDLGLVAAFEIEPVFVFRTEDHYQRILHGVDLPSFKGIYDPSHFDLMTGSAGKPEDMLLRVGVRNIGYVQFTDSDGTLREGGTSKHLPCGEGHIDCAKSLKILKEGGFRSWIMVDTWEVPDPYEACRRCKQAFDQL